MAEPTGDEIRELTAAIRAMGEARATRSHSVATIDAGKAASWITAAAAMFIAGACISALIIGGIVAIKDSNALQITLQGFRERDADLLAYHEQDVKKINTLQADIAELKRQLESTKK